MIRLWAAALALVLALYVSRAVRPAWVNVIRIMEVKR